MLLQCFNVEIIVCILHEISKADCCDICSGTSDCEFWLPFGSNARHVPVEKKITTDLGQETCVSSEWKIILREQLIQLHTHQTMFFCFFHWFLTFS